MSANQLLKEFLVTCISKPNRMSSHEHITHIGNITNDPANKWRLTREEAIGRIEVKEEAFYTVEGATGNKMYIGVVPPHSCRRQMERQLAGTG
jgi:hypothetical protein